MIFVCTMVYALQRACKLEQISREHKIKGPSRHAQLSHLRLWHLVQHASWHLLQQLDRDDITHRYPCQPVSLCALTIDPPEQLYLLQTLRQHLLVAAPRKSFSTAGVLCEPR